MKTFGLIGLLIGAAAMVMIEAPVISTIEDRSRYTAVYGTITALFLAVSILQILWAT